ncbi:hypothetical protein Tco_0906751 [Tanacetum coccineum]|uniref:Xylulose kinase-1 n=1 Tax=Tanacetum coccineum TaxID=301880 RepID=A0ABQ5CKR8_9ASTR
MTMMFGCNFPDGETPRREFTRKDGIVRILSPVTAAEIQAVEKERKAKNILLMAIPKEHMRRFHVIDDAKEIWDMEEKGLKLADSMIAIVMGKISSIKKTGREFMWM